MLQPYFAFGVPLFLLVLYLLLCTDSPSNNDSLFTVYFVTYFKYFSWFLVSSIAKNHGPSTLKR